MDIWISFSFCCNQHHHHEHHSMLPYELCSSVSRIGVYMRVGSLPHTGIFNFTVKHQAVP